MWDLGKIFSRWILSTVNFLILVWYEMKVSKNLYICIFNFSNIITFFIKCVPSWKAKKFFNGNKLSYLKNSILNNTPNLTLDLTLTLKLTLNLILSPHLSLNRYKTGKNVPSKTEPQAKKKWFFALLEILLKENS